TQKEVIIFDADGGEVSLSSPSACSTNEVQCFFFPECEIQSGTVGIYLIYIAEGRSNDKAFVKLDSVKFKEVVEVLSGLEVMANGITLLVDFLGEEYKEVLCAVCSNRKQIKIL
ncbi:hypothetical protein A6R68_01765, partial [Neotoma lepida]